MSRNLLRRCGSALALVLVAGATLGCGAKTGTVSGKVMFQGKPLPNVQVNFVPTDGYPVAVVTGADGSYTLAGVSYGSCKVTVLPLDSTVEDTRQEEDAARRAVVESGKGQKEYEEMRKEKTKTQARKVVVSGPNIPEKYRDPRTSPLIHNVTTNISTYDVALQD